MSWRRFFRRRQRDEELAREIESYLGHEIDDNIARGMSRDDALHAARRRFGNTTAVREAVYEMNSLNLVESVWQHIRLGLRQLRRNPAFACSGILILALGIGATTVIFSIAYGVLLRDLPYDQSERLVTLGSSPREFGFQSAYAGAADYFDWRGQQQVFEDMGLTRPVANYNLTGVGEPERLHGARPNSQPLFDTASNAPARAHVHRRRATRRGKSVECCRIELRPLAAAVRG